MTNQISTLRKWSEDIEDQINSWRILGNKEEVKNCESLLSPMYHIIIENEPIEMAIKSITFNSKMSAIKSYGVKFRYIEGVYSIQRG